MGYAIINTTDFDRDASFNASYVKNEVAQLYNDLEQIQGFYTSPGGQSRVLNIIELGQPLGQFQGSTFLGTWKTSEAATAAEFGAQPGDPKYLRDADGEIVFGSIGNGTPDFEITLSTRDEVFQQIERDYQAAESLLPVSSNLGATPPEQRAITKWG